MRPRTDPGNRRVAPILVIAALAFAAPCLAQDSPTPVSPPTSTATAPVAVTVPRIVIGRSPLAFMDRERQPFRDAVDNCVCVPPEAVAAALGTTFRVDERAHKVYFLNNETGAAAEATIRRAPDDSDLKGVFIGLTPLAEALGGKCELDSKTDTLYIRSVLTSVEMLGSQLRVHGTLPLYPKITRVGGGKTVTFDFIGAEIGTVSRNLTTLGPQVVKARTGQLDDNTARVVLELTEVKPFSWLPSPTPSTLAVLSSADSAAPPSATATPPVVVSVGPDGRKIAKAGQKIVALGKPAVPTLLRGVRFVRVSDTQARIIIDAASAPAIRTMITGRRFTLDVQNAVFGPGAQTTLPDAKHPLLAGVQSINTSATTAQLLVDLSRAVNYTVRLDPLSGLIIDLTLPKGAGGRIAGKLIVVDAGHGGHDHGAPGVNGEKEKNVALNIARRVADELRDKGANIIMTRDSDSFVTLAERSDISNRAGADMFIAIHADSAGAAADGSTIYYHLNDPSERTLAQCVAGHVAEMGGIRSRGPRSDGNEYTNGFSVLRRTRALAILCETGFMSNSHDAALLVRPEIQSRIARAIASGVQEYIEGNPQLPLTTSLTPIPPAAILPISGGGPSPDAIEQPKK